MSIETVDVRDLGTIFRVTFKEADGVVDVTAATVVEIEFTPPGGTAFKRTASKVSGTPEDIEYQRVADDIVKKGMWSYIGIATFSATEKYHSIEPTEFEVA